MQGVPSAFRASMRMNDPTARLRAITFSWATAPWLLIPEAKPVFTADSVLPEEEVPLAFKVLAEGVVRMPIEANPAWLCGSFVTGSSERWAQ